MACQRPTATATGAAGAGCGGAAARAASPAGSTGPTAGGEHRGHVAGACQVRARRLPGGRAAAAAPRLARAAHGRLPRTPPRRVQPLRLRTCETALQQRLPVPLLPSLPAGRAEAAAEAEAPLEACPAC